MNYFGTDGIRGTFGSTITEGTAFLLGKSLALSGGECPIVVVARDTRPSGDSLFCALSKGVYDGGGNVINLGVLPTNAVGHFTRKFGGDYGVMITASHNPPCDNGLKVFDRYGVKMCDAKQKVISRVMDSISDDSANIGKVTEPVFYDIENIYCEDILRTMNVDLQGFSVVLDCCYGATYRVAPMAFEKVGANVTVFCGKPCGNKINTDCGATCPEFLLSKAERAHCSLAFSFDGDGDRLCVAENGKIVPNNKVYYAFAKYLWQKGKLKHNAVVGTILTNGGVEDALRRLGVKLVRSDVGDTNVFNAMAQQGLCFGGEESGHYLLSEYATSSDAVINALFACKIYVENGSLFDYSADCEDIPYSAKSFALSSETQRLSSERAIAATSARINRLFPSCRFVIRKSGTENKIRAYVEGDDCNAAMDEIAATYVPMSK